MSKNILVTGGSGFIGSHIVDTLIKKRYNITVLDLINPKKKKIRFIKSSTLNFNLLKKVTKNIDYVFHLSGVSDITKVKKIPVRTIKNNILSSTYLLEACRINSVKRIFFASSIYAHGSSGNLYTTSKIATENIIKNYKLLYGLNYTILRYASAYGDNNRGVDVISIFLNKALKNLSINIHGDGKQTRDFTHAKDLARASVYSINKRFANKTLTIGTNKKTKIRDLAKKIIKISKSQSKILIKKKYKRFDDFDLNKVKKLKNKNYLKFKPHYNLDYGIREYINKINKK